MFLSDDHANVIVSSSDLTPPPQSSFLPIRTFYKPSADAHLRLHANTQVQAEFNRQEGFVP